MPRLGPFPSKEADLSLYFQSTAAYIIAHASRLLLTAGNQNHLQKLIDQWNIVYPASQSKNLRTMTVVADKNAAKDKLIALLRSIYKDIPENVWTSQDRSTLNLPVKKTSRTAAPVPDCTPLVRVNTINRLRHKISYTNQDGSLAKPYLSRGCQIWYKIGTPVAEIGELNYLCTSSVTPCTHDFNLEDAGKPVYYWLRWENTRGKTGPWSNEVMATITG